MVLRDKINRRAFARYAVDAVAAIAVALTAPFLSLLAPGGRSYAAASESRKRDPRIGYRRLGKTNIMVSEVSFGCALNYGCNRLGNKTNSTIQNLYAKALEVGINFFDTSTDADKQYVEEESFRFFRHVRDKVYLSTKVNDFEPGATRASIERSLKRMGTDYIDAVFLHNMSARGGWDKGLPALEEIRKMIKEGKVRFAGVSDHSYSSLIRLRNYAQLVDVVALMYNIKNVFRAEAVISEASSLDIGTCAIKVFGGAHGCNNDVATRWRNDRHLRPYLKKDATVAQATLRFVLDNPNVSTALIGMRTVTEIRDNVRTASKNSASVLKSSRLIEGNSFTTIYKLLNRFFGSM